MWMKALDKTNVNEPCDKMFLLNIFTVPVTECDYIKLYINVGLQLQQTKKSSKINVKTIKLINYQNTCRLFSVNQVAALLYRVALHLGRVM